MSDLVVGTIGRLVAEKGYREFFDAARRIRGEDPRVRFLAVGDPDPSKADALRAGELRAAGVDVVFTGWRDDVRDLLGLMDVFVLASWREGMPRSAIEAAAMGTAARPDRHQRVSRGRPSGCGGTPRASAVALGARERDQPAAS